MNKLQIYTIQSRIAKSVRFGISLQKGKAVCKKVRPFSYFSHMSKTLVWTLPLIPLVTWEKYQKQSTVVTQFGTYDNQFAVWKVLYTIPLDN